MEEPITKYFWVLFIIGMVLGILFPVISILSPYIMYMLMFVLFLSCLKTNFKEIFIHLRKPTLTLYLSFIILILTPLAFYFISNIFLDFEYSLAILILVAMPAGMVVPVYATIFKGNLPLALSLTIFTSLLAPFTIPFLIFLLTGIKTNINTFELFKFLAIVIFIPLVTAFIFKSFGKKFIKNTKKYYSPFSILIVTVIIMSAVAKANIKNIIGSTN